MSQDNGPPAAPEAATEQPASPTPMQTPTPTPEAPQAAADAGPSVTRDDKAGYVEERTQQVLVDAEPVMPRSVEIFTQSWCVPCKNAKAWMTKNNVRFRERDIVDADNRRAMHALFPNKQSVGTPVIQWDDQLLAGFSASSMEKLLYPQGRQVQQTVTSRQFLSNTPRDYNAMYTWEDSEGSFHISKSLDEVPKRYRARAQKRESY